MPKMVPVSSEQHGGKHLLPLKTYSFAAQQSLAALVAGEFAAAAQAFPIVFVKLEETFRPMALLGLKPDANLLVDSKGRWQADYIPAIFRRYPFGFLRTNEEAEASHVLGIDEECGLISEKEGEPMFTPEGKPARILEQALAFAAEFQKQVPLTNKLCDLLVQFDLLSPLRVTLQQEDKKLNIEGLFVVDEKKLAALADEDFLALRAAEVLPLVYAHLLSTKKMPVLTSRLKNGAGSKKEPGTAPTLPKSFTF